MCLVGISRPNVNVVGVGGGAVCPGNFVYAVDRYAIGGVYAHCLGEAIRAFADVDADMRKIAGVIQFNHQVAGPGVCNRGLSPGHASLPPDFVGDESGPSATSSGRAGVLVVIVCTSVSIGNLCNAVLGRRSARAETRIALAEVSLARISGLQLVQDFRYVGFRNRLAIGERTASGSLGRLRLGSRLDGLRCRSFRLGLGLLRSSEIGRASCRERV